jgi:hypothetical protein
MRPVRNALPRYLHAFVEQCVASGSTIRTDDWHGYLGLAAQMGTATSNLCPISTPKKPGAATPITGNSLPSSLTLRLVTAGSPPNFHGAHQAANIHRSQTASVQNQTPLDGQHPESKQRLLLIEDARQIRTVLGGIHHHQPQNGADQAEIATQTSQISPEHPPALRFAVNKAQQLNPGKYGVPSMLNATARIRNYADSLTPSVPIQPAGQ